MNLGLMRAAWLTVLRNEAMVTNTAAFSASWARSLAESLSCSDDSELCVLYQHCQ